MSSLKKSLLSFFSIFCISYSTTLHAQDAPDLIQNREYKEALELLKGDVKDDALLLLKARAQVLTGQFEDAIITTKKLTSEHPQSKWIQKAQFIEAQAHSQLKRYEEASSIFETEAEKLFSPSYKDKGAQLLLEVAAKFSHVPETAELDRSNTDFNKAIKLLHEALSLECSIEMKETIHSELISLLIKLENWNDAIAQSLLYLDQYDPNWRGPLESITRLTASDEPENITKLKLVGKNRGMIRFHLCEAYHRSNQRVLATRYLTEFIKELKDANDPNLTPLLADATWLRLMTLREEGGKPRNLQAWIADVKTYLHDYPNHLHAQATAYAIGHIYLTYDEKENAIAAFQKYIDEYHAVFPEKPITARPETKKELLARQESANSRFELAHYEIGKIFLQLNQFVKAQQAWNQYSQKFPNGSKWADCQKGLVDIDFSIATHAVTLIQDSTDKETARAAAQKSLDDFIAKHPLDGRIPTALFLKGNIPYQQANELDQQLKSKPDETQKNQQLASYQTARDHWTTLTTKYPRSTHAIQAQYLIASIYENHLGDIEKALEIYAQSSHRNANSEIQRLKAVNLIASSDTTFTTSENPHIKLSSRNIEKVTVKQYWLDIESYFRKARMLQDISSLDIDLIEADKTWEVTLPDYKKYYTMDSKLDIPFPENKPGICVIKVESETFSSTTLVVRSNIDIAVRANKDEIITYAHLAGKENRPASNIQVIIADGAKVITTGKTDTQGVFHYRDATLNEVEDLRVLALSETGAATCAIYTNGIPPSEKLQPRAWFNIAKPAYLPGEIIEIAGVIRFPASDTSKNIYQSPTPEQRNYNLTIKDSNSKKLLYEKKITTSPTGIFQHSYKLPSYLSYAYLEIQITPDFDKELEPFSHSFSINKDAEPSVTLKLELDKKWTASDPIINGKIIAEYRWGAAYANKKITVELPNNKEIHIKTDDNGEATFRYDSQFDEAGKVIEFYAYDYDGEHESNVGIVLIDPIDFSILASTDLASVASGTDVTLTAKTILPDETPVSKELKLEVLQLINIKQNPILFTCAGLENLTSASTRENIIQTITLTTDAQTGKAQHILKFEKAGRYLLRITAQDSKGREVIARSSVDVHDSTSNNKLIIFTDKRDLQAGKSVTINTFSYLKSQANALLTVETDKIIEKRIVTLMPGKNEISLTLTSAHTPIVRVNLIAIHDRKFYTASDMLPVANKLTLKVTTKKVELADDLKKFDYKAQIQAFDANGNPVPADFFINLTHRTNILSFINHENANLTEYAMGTNCGLMHRGSQDMILTEIRDELQRMEQEQLLSSHRPNLPGLLPQLNNPNQADPFSVGDSGFENEDFYNISQTRTSNNPKSNFFNPDGKDNFNGNDFSGNQNTLAQYKRNSPPELPQSVGVGGGLDSGTGGNIFPMTPATPVGYLSEITKNTTAFAEMVSIPAEGKEILLTDKLIYGELKLHILGVDQNTAFGIHEEDLDTNLKDLVATPGADLVGTTIMKNASIVAKKGSNKITLTIPENSKPTALKLTSSRNHAEFFENLTSASLVSPFSSETPFHEPHPAGQLMAVCGHLDYLIAHKLDLPAQEILKTSASRLCAELTLSQNEDGSWSQIKHRKANSLIHTALAYQALMMAKNLGITHEKSTITAASTWISQQQKSLATDLYSSRSIVQLALAASGDADFATCNRLFRERAKMDNIGKAILANVFVLLEKNDFTATLLKEITDENKVTHPEESLLSSAILLDALKLNAQVAIKENPTVKFTHHFSNDVEKAYAAYAYSRYLKAITPLAPADLTISINGTAIKDTTIPNNLLKPGDNEIQIESTQDGAIISAELIARQTLEKLPKVENFIVTNRNYYKEKLSYKGIELESSGTSPVTQSEIGGIVHVHLKGEIKNKAYPDTILIEEIPAGFTYQAGSLSGNHSGARQEGNHLVITYGTLPDKFHLSYTLIAEHEGVWTHNPSVLSASYDPKIISNNSPTKLTILAKGIKDNTPYEINAQEHYELAQLHFTAKEYAESKQHIIAYRKLKQSNEDPILARMLLWIETDQAQPDAQLLADSFEILTERNPDLVIPFDKILKVGSAYRKLGEFERSIDVYTATLEAGYSADSYVGAALEDQGKFITSIDYQNSLWLLYPDLDEISSSRFALSQQIYSKSTSADSLGKNPATDKPYSEKDLIEMSLEQTQDFLTHTPEHELADDAAFSIANALFALKSYDTVVKHTAKAIVIHKDSEHATSFRYMQALGHFWLRNYDQALKAASEVASGNSDDKDLASFITAQIYHAKGMPEKAIEWYKGIEDTYPDARESIAYFEQKSISLDEVKVLNSGDKFSFNLKFRNIKEAQFQVYRVDLMQLYLRQKNLSNISEINLAGITPKFTLTTNLGSGQDFQEREKLIELPVKDDGAYLVICRGDYLHTSGLILITPLKLEVQEYPEQEALRVNISDKKSGEYIDSVHVKAIGHEQSIFKTGETDLRGVWQTEEISSPSTVIAKDPKGRYAFFRSQLKPTLMEAGSANQTADDPFSDEGGTDAFEAPKKVDFNRNLMEKQDTLNKSKLQEYEQKRRAKGKGVEIQKARKK